MNKPRKEKSQKNFFEIFTPEEYQMAFNIDLDTSKKKINRFRANLKKSFEKIKSSHR